MPITPSRKMWVVAKLLKTFDHSKNRPAHPYLKCWQPATYWLRALKSGKPATSFLCKMIEDLLQAALTDSEIVQPKLLLALR